ncbi:hypothetical protein SPURM210S_07618 [Streptomyces purpurascens]
MAVQGVKGLRRPTGTHSPEQVPEDPTRPQNRLRVYECVLAGTCVRMVGAQNTKAVGEVSLVEANGFHVFPKFLELVRQIAARDKGVGMLRAEDTQASVETLPAERDGPVLIAQPTQRRGQTGLTGKRVRMVRTENTGALMKVFSEQSSCTLELPSVYEHSRKAVPTAESLVVVASEQPDSRLVVLLKKGAGFVQLSCRPKGDGKTIPAGQGVGMIRP